MPATYFFRDGSVEAALAWFRRRGDDGGVDGDWRTRLVCPPAPESPSQQQQQQKKKRALSCSASSSSSSAVRYMRCSRRHAEIDLSLLGPDPLPVWRACYAQCLARAGHCAAPFLLLLTHADRMPPALGSVIHGFRTNVWNAPDRPLVFAFLGQFLPCAALQASVLRVALPPLPPLPLAADDLAPTTLQDELRRLAVMRPYPYRQMRETLYRAQMFCVALPELVLGVVQPCDENLLEGSADARAAMGDWAARSRHIFHAEKLVHAWAIIKS